MVLCYCRFSQIFLLATTHHIGDLLALVSAPTFQGKKKSVFQIEGPVIRGLAIFQSRF